MNPLCIWHGGCDDGFAAAWAVYMSPGGSDYEFHPGVYQQPPPDVTGRDVVLVDFSYKRDVLERMIAQAASVVVLDHHKTAEKDLAPLMNGGGLGGVFDMSRSGSMITWDWFHPREQAPPLMAYIQDRDLWRKELPGCDMVIMALRSYPQEFDVWSRLMASDPAMLMEQGEHIHRYYRTLVEQAKKSALWLMMKDFYVPVVNVPHYLASEVAGELCGYPPEPGAPPCPFAACYWRNADGGWTFSLRSRDGFDVGAFAAENFGGGGHPGAAGFRVNSLKDL